MFRALFGASADEVELYQELVFAVQDILSLGPSL